MPATRCNRIAMIAVLRPLNSSLSDLCELRGQPISSWRFAAIKPQRTQRSPREKLIFGKSAKGKDRVMGTFLIGWRRKTALVLLGTALLLTTGWVRSFVIRDVFSFDYGDSTISFRSLDGGLGGQWFSPCWRFASKGWRSDYDFRWSISDPWWQLDNFDPADIQRNWEWAGFSLGSAAKTDPPLLRRLTLCVVPYWTIVLPLVVSSVWLLFRGRRTEDSRMSPSSYFHHEAGPSTVNCFVESTTSAQKPATTNTPQHIANTVFQSWSVGFSPSARS
jgi:hypothetical protein